MLNNYKRRLEITVLFGFQAERRCIVVCARLNMRHESLIFDTTVPYRIEWQDKVFNGNPVIQKATLSPGREVVYNPIQQPSPASAFYRISFDNKALTFTKKVVFISQT